MLTVLTHYTDGTETVSAAVIDGELNQNNADAPEKSFLSRVDGNSAPQPNLRRGQIFIDWREKPLTLMGLGPASTDLDSSLGITRALDPRPRAGRF